MHIKKLDISGFKSFVDRTVIHFDHDVIGIVGPNGCGKSNIVDAIRWCIGEQSAKHLRGRSMTDVIFAGSSSRGPHGMAEVTITFDNSDHETAQALPLEYRDYAEIAVTRRLYRDGASEYLVNKTQVRLKDITDLFLGTGVGTKAYSIIEQGKIGLIVSARAEDRRLIIEEAAGVTKYKARRKQAEQKMDLTRQNLLRVGDIVSEIERNLASLKRQSAKAERYVSYKGELEDLVLHDASHRLLELIALTGVEEAGRAGMSETEQAARATLDARDAELEVARQTALTAEDATESAQNASYRADNDVRVHEGEIERSREKLSTLETRRVAAGIESNDLASKLTELAAERATLEHSLEHADVELAREAEKVTEETTSLDELVAQEREAAAALALVAREASEAQAAIAGAEATLSGYERRFTEMEVRRERLDDEAQRLVFDAEDAATRRTAIAGQIAELAEGKVVSVEQKERLEVELLELRERSVATDKTVDTAKNELSQRRNRLRALEEIHDKLEGVGAGAKALFATKDAALRGLVADRFEAPAHLTEAFAGLLGERLSWAVVDDVERGIELLAQLARNNAGRAGIIASRPRFVAGRTAASTPRAEGVVGRLIDHIAYDPSDESLARALFGDAVLVENDAVATALLREGAASLVVTLRGTVFGPDGEVRGGAGDALAAGLIAQKREMRELHDIIAVKSDEVTALLEAQQKTRLRMTEVGAALDRARTEAHQGELALVTAEKDLRGAEDKLAATEKRLGTVRAELTELAEKVTAVTGEQAEAEAVLATGRERHFDAEKRRGEAEEGANECRTRVSRQQGVVTERRIQFAQVKERAQSLGQTVERLARSCEEMSTRIARLETEAFECASGAGQAAARIMVERAELIDAIDIARIAEGELRDARVALEAVRTEVASREVDLKRLRTDLEGATDTLRTHEASLAKLDIERRHLVDGIRERFRGLELPTVVGDYHKRPPVEASHRARIGELAELIDRMGPVNLDAVREHAEADERFTYYTSQRDDLVKALADLEQAIVQMNKETKRLFRDAFEGINERFKALFPRMFRGGTAELRLTNPEDMLETGIEILAQPPGKKLASIDLMSGGEKALTAVSLIFAIFQFKPSPFCILDEVDAPLDEANVTRYNEGIRAMTDRSQFILITHIKRTMQSVDVLYGVTMQEPGVSKLVSVKVNDAVGSRSAQKRSAAPPQSVNPEAEAVAVA